MKRPADPAAHGEPWYRQPVLWLGLAVFVASLAGCVWVIVAGVRYADVPIDEAPAHHVLGVPTHHPAHVVPPPAPAGSSR